MQTITVSTTIHLPIQAVREKWNTPSDIVQWYSGHPDWHTPRAENNLTVGGKFNTRMEAKDGSMGFDFEGTYTTIEPMSLIEYMLPEVTTPDGVVHSGRKVSIQFSFDAHAGTTTITETFDAEEMNPLEQQQAGRQHILNNFKSYCEK